jgi:hypothetical protein
MKNNFFFGKIFFYHNCIRNNYFLYFFFWKKVKLYARYPNVLYRNYVIIFYIVDPDPFVKGTDPDPSIIK